MTNLERHIQHKRFLGLCTKYSQYDTVEVEVEVVVFLYSAPS